MNAFFKLHGLPEGLAVRIFNETGFGRILARQGKPERLPDGTWQIDVVLEAEGARLRVVDPARADDEGPRIEPARGRGSRRPGA